MSAFLEDIVEIITAPVADLSPYCCMGEGSKTYPMQTHRVDVF